MFIFPLDPAELFAERVIQMQGWGIPAKTINIVRKTITDTWKDGPGGWTHEWVQQARKAEQAGKWLEAAACYGAAKFPVVCTPARELALQSQVKAYLHASENFLCHFERTEVHVPYKGNDLPVVVHLFEPRGRKRRNARPLVCLTGGVDTCKMELHCLAVALAVFGGFRVAAMDMPGTAESTVALRPDADLIYCGVIEKLNVEQVKTAIVGISFGGHWAAKLALCDAVDAAVDIGGPVGFATTDAALFTSLPNGMTGIVANAMGMNTLPSFDEAAQWMSSFSLREQGLFDSEPRCHILAINGNKDPYIAIDDTVGFAAFPNASVWLVKDGYHCAAEQFPRILPSIVAWLRTNLHGKSIWNSTLAEVARLTAPPLIPWQID